MSPRLAQFLSVVFHPLLMPTILFGVLLLLVPGTLNVDAFLFTVRLSLLVLIFIGTFAVPALLTFYLFRSGYVRSLHMNDLADRRLPFFLTALVYCITTYLFAFRMQVISTLAPEIAIILGSISLSVLLMGIISLYWQISAHSVGIGGTVGLLIGMMLKYSLTELFTPIILLVLIAGLVASARLELNAHTPAQVGIGLLLGLTISLLTVAWLIY